MNTINYIIQPKKSMIKMTQMNNLETNVKNAMNDLCEKISELRSIVAEHVMIKIAEKIDKSLDNAMNAISEEFYSRHS